MISFDGLLRSILTQCDTRTFPKGEGEKDSVPFLVKRSVEFIQQFTQIEGLFRISASHSTLQDVKSQIDTSDDFGASAIDLLTVTAHEAQRQHTETPPASASAESEPTSTSTSTSTLRYHTTAVVVAHLLCGLLKQFLRELERPLLLVEMFEEWMIVLDASEQESRNQSQDQDQDQGQDRAQQSVGVTKAVINRLPEEHRRVLCAVLGLSWQLSREKHRTFNKMTTSNMATVVGPNLIRPPDSLLTPESFGRINSLAEFLIESFPVLFPVQDPDRSCLGLSFDA